jgi:hypothetical protein
VERSPHSAVAVAIAVVVAFAFAFVVHLGDPRLQPWVTLQIQEKGASAPGICLPPFTKNLSICKTNSTPHQSCKSKMRISSTQTGILVLEIKTKAPAKTGAFSINGTPNPFRI